MHAHDLTTTTPARNPRGFRDLDPARAYAHERIVERIREVAHLFGYVPLHTPAIEHLDVLSEHGSEEARRTTFLVSAPEQDDLGLRPDLTVSLARHVAQNPDLPLPFRRYQVAQVWRADKPDKGRYREFTQFDFDAVGVDAEIADVEAIAVPCEALARLDVGPFRVHMSSRCLLDLLLDYAGIPYAQGPNVFRVLDKLGKVGIIKVRLELTDGYTDPSGDKIPGLGLTRKQVHRIQAFLDIRSSERAEVITGLRDLFRHIHGAAEEIDSVERISRDLHAVGYGDEHVEIDLSIARGLGYYTGPIFEAVLLDAPEVGSVAGGGRYDRLVEKFGARSIPATGVSLGVDRILAAIEKQRAGSAFPLPPRVVVTSIDPALTHESLQMLWELRRAGVPAELYMGAERSVGRQLKYADHTDARIAILYGGDEHAKGVVTVKDMAAGRKMAASADERGAWLAARAGQCQVKRSDLVPFVARILEEQGEG